MAKHYARSAAQIAAALQGVERGDQIVVRSEEAAELARRAMERMGIQDVQIVIDDRAADARAAEIAGWTWRSDGDTAYLSLLDKSAAGVIRQEGRTTYCPALPAFGSDPAAARALLEAVPVEKRHRIVEALLEKITPDIRLYDVTYDDLWPLFLTPPAAIRDAVLEVMGDTQ